MSARRRSVAITLVAVATLALGARASLAQPAPDAVAFPYAATYGTTDTPWQRSNAFLNQPMGLGADRDGVWVANTGGRHLVRFGTGPVEEIGRAGSLDGLYGLPARAVSDVAVAFAPRQPGQAPTPTPTPDPGGVPPLAPLRTVWFADAGAHVVVGIYLSPYGQTGRPTILGEHGVAGADEAHFRNPSSVAVDPYGYLYVSDTGNHRVLVLGPDRKRVATIGQTGTPGAGPNQLNRPGRLVVAPDGRLYLADSGNYRVLAYDIRDPKSPKQLQSYGRGPGTGPGELSGPLAVAADASFVYIADGGRVLVWQKADGKPWRSLDGVATDACGNGDPAQRWPLVSDVALDESGNVYVALPSRMQVHVCDAFDRGFKRAYGAVDTPYTTHDGLYNTPVGVAVAANGDLTIVEDEGQRVLRRTAGGLQPWAFGVPGMAGAGDDRLDHPSDVALLADGRSVIADTGNDRLVVLGPDGQRLATWGAGTLKAPEGVAALPDGRVAVADTGAGRIVLFSSTGALAGSPPGAAAGPFTAPADVAVDPAGNWYVSDRAEHVVRRFDPAGAARPPLGSPGNGGNAFDRLWGPRGLALGADGRLFVADSLNNRVQAFAGDGTYLTTIGGADGTGTGDLSEPWGVAVGPDGRAYVADTFSHRIQVFALAAEPWLPAVTNGFGRHSVERVSALAELDGRLYAGLADASAGAGLWRRQAGGPWELAAAPGFAGPGHRAIDSLYRRGDWLYAGTEHRLTTVDPATGDESHSSAGGDLYRSPDGQRWDKVAGGGFGDAKNSGVSALAEFKGQLYAGTRGLAADGAGAQLWRSASGDAATWQRVRIDLFTRTEWVKNGAISALAYYSNTLIAGTCASDKPQVWGSLDGSVWRAVGFREPDQDPRDALPQLGSGGNACVTSLVEYDGYLYAGLGNELTVEQPATGASAPPTNPTPVPTRGPGPGPRPFGAESVSTDAAPAANPAEFAGTRASEVWRCKKCDGTDWDPATSPGLGKRFNRGRIALAPFDEPPFRYLYLAVGNSAEGLEIWRAQDGMDWEPLVPGGLGDDNNADVGGGAAIAVYDGRLHLGTLNGASGGELWSTAGSRPGVVPTPPGPTLTPTPRPSPQPPTGRARYRKIDEWPIGQPAALDVLGNPVDMAVADDGEVYLLDTGPVRVARLLPDGSWGEPFGGTGSGPDRVTRSMDPDTRAQAALAVDSTAGRVYVSDLGTERVVVFDRAGNYLDSWRDIYAVDVDVRSDGSVWVADLLAGAVRRLGPDGKEIERLGHYGPQAEDGLLGLVEAVEDLGGRLWVADQGGQRLRAFERDGGGWKRVRTLNLGTDAMMRRGCGAARLQALGDNRVLAGPCVFDQGRFVVQVPANHPGSDLRQVGLRTANLRAGRFYGFATHDILPRDDTNETYPTVIRYFDAGFDIVTDFWRGRWFEPGTAAQEAVLDAQRLSTAPDGTLYMTDYFGLRRFSPEGRVLDQAGMAIYPSRSATLDLDPRLTVGTGERGMVIGVGQYTYGRAGNAQVVVYGRTTQRRYCQAGECELGRYLEPVWMTTLEAGNRRVPVVEFNYAVAHEPTKNQFVLLQLFIDNPAQLEFPARLFIFPIDGRGRKTEIVLEGDDRQALWTDVDAGPTGRIYALDTLRDLVQVFDADGKDLGRVTTPKDVWKVAGGPNNEIYVLTTYGHVVRMAADGTVLSRFVGLPNGIAPFTAQVDLAVDDYGRVFVVDNLYQQVTVFEAEGTEEDVLEGGKCNLSGDKWVSPTDILLGDTAELFLRLFGSCGYQEEPADIVLAINASPYSEVENLQVARQIMSLVDLDRHRLGVVSFVVSGNVESPLTQNREQLIRALMAITGGRPTGCGTNVMAGMQTAAKDVFDFASPRRKVLILIQPEEDPPPGDCAWDYNKIAAVASDLTAQGVTIVAVNGPDPATVAASSEVLALVQVEPRGQGVGRPALRRTMARRWPDSLLTLGTLTDQLPANIDYVAGSARPPAAWDAASRTLTWNLADLKLNDTHEFTLRIRPKAEGLWPTNVQAVADGTDGWGNPVRAVLPIPKIRVYGEPPPTPTRTPTRTPTPGPTNTPEPTPTPRPTRPVVPLYLPILLRTEACLPGSQNADVAVVIDTSGSMTETTSPGGPTKLEAAREAARQFVLQLVAGRDQAAIIQFNATVTVIEPLTPDIARAAAGLDRLTQAQGTRIDLAINAAVGELTGPNKKPGNNPVIILLTDGAPVGATPDEVRAAAEAAKAAGMLIYTIGLGQDVDHVLLRDVASKPEWYFFAPDTGDLAEIYGQIAYSIPCKPMWP